MQTERITSIQNPLLQHIRKLQSSRAYRESCGEFVADGWKLLCEAQQWYPHITTVIVAQSAACPQFSESVRVAVVPDGLMDRLSSMRTPQGVLFVCHMPDAVPLKINAGMLLLDGIQDPGNLGTILRTADAFAIPIVLTNDCADPFSEKAVRSSMGAVFRAPPQCASWQEIQAARAQIPIAATAFSAQAEDIRAVDLSKYIVVIGSEGQGICREILQASEKQVMIPMQQHCESLNAAIAASIVMWQIKK